MFGRKCYKPCISVDEKCNLLKTRIFFLRDYVKDAEINYFMYESFKSNVYAADPYETVGFVVNRRGNSCHQPLPCRVLKISLHNVLLFRDYFFTSGIYYR